MYLNVCFSFIFFIIYELDFVEDIWFVKINNKINMFYKIISWWIFVFFVFYILKFIFF